MEMYDYRRQWKDCIDSAGSSTGSENNMITEGDGKEWLYFISFNLLIIQ